MVTGVRHSPPLSHRCAHLQPSRRGLPQTNNYDDVNKEGLCIVIATASDFLLTPAQGTLRDVSGVSHTITTRGGRKCLGNISATSTSYPADAVTYKSNISDLPMLNEFDGLVSAYGVSDGPILHTPGRLSGAAGSQCPGGGGEASVQGTQLFFFQRSPVPPPPSPPPSPPPPLLSPPPPPPPPPPPWGTGEGGSMSFRERFVEMGLRIQQAPCTSSRPFLGCLLGRI